MMSPRNSSSGFVDLRAFGSLEPCAANRTAEALLPPPAPGLPTFGRRPSSSGITSNAIETWVCTSVSNVSDRSTGRCGSTLEPGGRTITFMWYEGSPAMPLRASCSSFTCVGVIFGSPGET